MNHSTLLLSVQQDLSTLVSASKSQNVLPISTSPCDPTVANTRAENAFPRFLSPALSTANGFRENISISSIKHIPNRELRRPIVACPELIEIRTECRVRLRHGLFRMGVELGPVSCPRYSGPYQERRTGLPIYRGYGLSVLLQNGKWMSRRVALRFACYSNTSLPGLNLRFNIHFPRLIPADSPCYRAAIKGDLTSVRQWLLSGRVSISDVTIKGDTLLHVSTGCD